MMMQGQFNNIRGNEDDVRMNMNSRNNTPGMYGNNYTGSNMNRGVGGINSNNSNPNFNNSNVNQNQTLTGGYYSSGMSGIGAPSTVGGNEQDNRSIASTPSKISKFTYSGEFN